MTDMNNWAGLNNTQYQLIKQSIAWNVSCAYDTSVRIVWSGYVDRTSYNNTVYNHGTVKVFDYDDSEWPHDVSTYYTGMVQVGNMLEGINGFGKAAMLNNIGNVLVVSSLDTIYVYKLNNNNWDNIKTILNYTTDPCNTIISNDQYYIRLAANKTNVDEKVSVFEVQFDEPSPETFLSGSLQDGYIQYSTGELIDLSNDNVIETVITDYYGNYTLNTPVSSLPDYYKIKFTGGVDLGTGESLIGSLSNVSTRLDAESSNEAKLYVSPITTIVSSKLEDDISSGITLSLSTISNTKSTISISLGISINDLNKDYIASEDSTMAKITQQLEIISNTLSITVPNTKEISAMVGSDTSNKNLLPPPKDTSIWL